MSAPIKTFVFFDKRTGLEIFHKRSRQTNFVFDCDDFYSESVEEAGTTEATVPSDFILKKIKAAIWLRATFDMIRDGVEQDFSPSSLSEVNIHASQQPQFQALMAEERQILLDRIADNQKRFEPLILQAVDNEQLSREILLMRKNVVLGIYSPVERERAKINGIF